MARELRSHMLESNKPVSHNKIQLRYDTDKNKY